MNIESELLNVEIEKIKTEINDTSVGVSLLGIFFLAIIPLFYSIMGIYEVTFDDIKYALILSVAIMFIATILSVLHWEQNSIKLKKLYARKVEMITARPVIEEVEAIKTPTSRKRKK